VGREQPVQDGVELSSNVRWPDQSLRLASWSLRLEPRLEMYTSEEELQMHGGRWEDAR
jgi:hypothetical protein